MAIEFAVQLQRMVAFDDILAQCRSLLHEWFDCSVDVVRSPESNLLVNGAIWRLVAAESASVNLVVDDFYLPPPNDEENGTWAWVMPWRNDASLFLAALVALVCTTLSAGRLVDEAKLLHLGLVPEPSKVRATLEAAGKASSTLTSAAQKIRSGDLIEL